jgi:tetratricopeptide (TPR) repeat protein
MGLPMEEPTRMQRRHPETLSTVLLILSVRLLRREEFPMNRSVLLPVSLLLFLLAGCSAAGVVYTRDPLTKIHSAYQMMDYGRAIPAERFIQEALEAYQTQGDELGMAEAHFAYGNFYKNGQLWEAPPLEKSEDHFEESKALYEQNHDFFGVAKSLFGIGNIYQIKQQNAVACEYYDQSLQAYKTAKQKNPSAPDPKMLSGHKDFFQMVEAFKEDIGCT